MRSLPLRRRELLGMTAGTLAAGLPRTLPAGAEIRFGTAVSADVLARDPAYAELVRRECVLLVPEWEMKWAAVQPEPGRFDFRGLDRIAAFARGNGMALRGHALLWHREAPAWLADRLTPANCESLLRAHFTEVMERHAGLTDSWDVVNEAVEPEDGRADGLRRSFWLERAGEGYIETAFRIAAERAPGAELVYNEYGCEHDGDWSRRRRAAVLRLLERLKGDGVPVHALGLQAHLQAGAPFSSAGLAAFLREVRALGLRVLVTELDVRGGGPGSPAERDAEVASLYRAFLDTVLEQASCDTVVTWGLSDRHSWLRREAGPEERPLPFDEELRPKPAWTALREALAAAEGRHR
ncbi:endo-1,4-beta-xylanase [Azospirillum sp. SYSU D00513]|uniref:endo-1,4-beta-xylanase n=1 Tax=Azospirillum sp. SYSU D00513 TaxID=2812561 RepID=UPI001A960B1D|nr:endo-1,4-beta-xylanase [Azospirillum sp. SYSU D00513]